MQIANINKSAIFASWYDSILKIMMNYNIQPIILRHKYPVAVGARVDTSVANKILDFSN